MCQGLKSFLGQQARTFGAAFVGVLVKCAKGSEVFLQQARTFGAAVCGVLFKFAKGKNIQG
eukprot:11415320-Prorocentrum_lima.AAC.1